MLAQNKIIANICRYFQQPNLRAYFDITTNDFVQIVFIFKYTVHALL